nr:MAG TPA: hypothetical protein [Caudoviricetes sp.]DAY30334.1 MAG TPA: hypothetical protein [Inoviridae sp.]
MQQGFCEANFSGSLIYFAPSGASPDGIFARQALFTS